MLVDGARFCVYFCDVISILRRTEVLKKIFFNFLYVKMINFSNIESINCID